MSGNSGAWGIAMWKDGRGGFDVPPQQEGISLEGGGEIVPFLPTDPLGCLLLPPDGLGVPPVRAGDVAFAQRDGVVQFGDYYEPRILTFQVMVCNEGCPGCPSGRERVKRLTEEWSRNCSGATLVILTDCHSPTATQDEKRYLGPYMVHGRPRVAEVTWLRSNVGCARITLRFDCEDARLLLAVSNDPTELFPWHASHSVDADANANLAPDYRLDGLTMTLNGATVDDTHLSAGGPDDGSYFNRNIISPNTGSPMVMALSDTGTDAIPVTAGQAYTVSWWAQKNFPGGAQTQVNWQWYDAGGAALSLVGGVDQDPGDTWERLSQTNVAPVGAAFGQPQLTWTGIALAGQALDFAQAWVNEGAVATEPAVVEIVGDLCVFPVIRLSGFLTAPIVVNYGPYQFTYNEDVVNNVVIDTKWGRAADITVDTTQFLSGNYTTPLDPGLHEFSMTSGDPSDTGSARLEWSNAVVSG